MNEIFYCFGNKLRELGSEGNGEITEHEYNTMKIEKNLDFFNQIKPPNSEGRGESGIIKSFGFIILGIYS